MFDQWIGIMYIGEPRTPAEQWRWDSAIAQAVGIKGVYFLFHFFLILAIKNRNSHPSMGVDLNDRPAWQMCIGVILMDRFLQEISHINSCVRHKLNIKPT